MLTRFRVQPSYNSSALPNFVLDGNGEWVAYQDAMQAIATARAEAERLAKRLEEERERFYDKALAWRDIDFKEDACPKCGGSGVVTYGSTATWVGGIGGQSMTSGVCDQCWGSGNKNHKWTDLRKARAALAAHEEGKNVDTI